MVAQIANPDAPTTTTTTTKVMTLPEPAPVPYKEEKPGIWRLILGAFVGLMVGLIVWALVNQWAIAQWVDILNGPNFWSGLVILLLVHIGIPLLGTLLGYVLGAVSYNRQNKKYFQYVQESATLPTTTA